MAFSGMLRRVALVITDVSEELSTFVVRVTRIGDLGTSAATSNRRTLRSSNLTLLLVFKGFIYLHFELIVLLRSASEAQSIIWYKSVIFNHFEEFLNKSSSNFTIINFTQSISCCLRCVSLSSPLQYAHECLELGRLPSLSLGSNNTNLLSRWCQRYLKLYPS
jgi:hypothetical protein